MSTDTQRKETVHISEQECKANGTFQYLLEKKCSDVPNPPPISADNHLTVFSCGETGFKHIYNDINNAKKSVDLICWGFDPAMMLIRNDGKWDKTYTYGYLLEQVASRGIKIRLLVWYNYIASFKQNNMPGYSTLLPARTSDEVASTAMAMMGSPYIPSNLPKDDLTERSDFCIEWYRKVTSGHMKNITLGKRDGQTDAIKKSLEDEQNKPSKTGIIDENYLLKRNGTHHQKTILIDYEAPNKGIGYIKGLNSLTAYWDSAQHLIEEPRRELTTNKDEKAGLYQHRKPFQDYACRIEGGGVLEQIHANFLSAWGRVKPKDPEGIAARIAPVGKVAVQAPPTKSSITKSKLPPSRAQVLRTQPEEHEKSIKAFYYHSFKMAVDYMYIENQYFFYPEWADALKEARKAWVTDWNVKHKASTNPAIKARVKKQDIPQLHLFVVIPEPEIKQMVPRTYETLKFLGQEQHMQGVEHDNYGNPILDKKTGKPIETGQTKMLNDWEDEFNQDMEKYKAMVTSYQQQIAKDPQSARWILQPTTPPQRTYHSDVEADAAKITKTDDAYLKKNCAMKSSIAMLYTCGMASRKMAYRDIYIHSKLMIVDDHSFTLGSANLNQRSMAVDSEINIASDDPQLTRNLREMVFKQHSGEQITGGSGQQVTQRTFGDWNKLMQTNAINRNKKKPLQGFLLPFEELRTCQTRWG